MERKNKLFIWIIILLLATNLATIGSVLYHVYSDNKTVREPAAELPNEQRTKFLVDQLGLSIEQSDEFRNMNRTFNRTANPITRDLEDLRLQMLDELAKESPDKEKLTVIAEEIGNLHTELKQATIDLYLQMKSICTEDQQTKLYQIFHSMLNQEEDVKLPRGRHQGGRGRNSNNN